MKRNVILIIILLVVIGIILFGYLYSFRNFGDQGNWKPINEYKIPKTKYMAEKSILRLSDKRSNMWLSDFMTEFTKDGWFTAFIVSKTDTSEFIFRFITPTTIKSIPEKYVHEKTSLFEDSLIKKL